MRFLYSPVVAVVLHQQTGMLYCKFYRYFDNYGDSKTTIIMWHLSMPILNIQLLSLILTCLRTYKNLNVFSILHMVCIKKCDDSYGDMLYILNIPPLSERRKLLRMCYLYKNVPGFVDLLNAPFAFTVLFITSWITGLVLVYILLSGVQK